MLCSIGNMHGDGEDAVACRAERLAARHRMMFVVLAQSTSLLPFPFAILIVACSRPSSASVPRRSVSGAVVGSQSVKRGGASGEGNAGLVLLVGIVWHGCLYRTPLIYNEEFSFCVRTTSIHGRAVASAHQL